MALLVAACEAVPPGEKRRVSRVSDELDLLDADGERRIRAYLDWVSSERGIDYHVVVAALGNASGEERSSRLFAERAVGETTAGHGLLLFVDPWAQEVRVEVGYALEPFLTDVDASRMLADFLAPYFRAGEPAVGIEASIEGLIEKLSSAERSQLAASGGVAGEEAASAARSRGAAAGSPASSSSSARRGAPAPPGSGGAGASLRLLRGLPDGALDEAARRALREILVPQPDPRSARDLEIALLHKGIYFQEAALYDETWRRAAWPGAGSPARLREIARQWDRPYQLVVEDPLAVAYYPDAPALGPTFLRRESAGWIIDATRGAREIVYDYSNQAWYALDGSPYLELLQRALPLRRVTLQSGSAAWQME